MGEGRNIGKLCIALALLLAVGVIHAQELAAMAAEDEVARSIDDDLGLLNIGLPEFADIGEATEMRGEDDDSDEDEDLTPDEDKVDESEDADDDTDDDESDVETIKRNQRGKWQRIRGERRRHRQERWGGRSNSTEADGHRGGRQGGRRPWRNQQSITNDDEDAGESHHHRHRKGNDNGNGRHHRGRHGRHGPGRNRHHRGRHFRFNATEAKGWEGATWQQKVDHICEKLTRHKSRIQRLQQSGTGSPKANTRRERRMEFLGRMEECCSEEQRDSCFYHLRHQVCEDSATLQPLRQNLPQPVRLAFSRIKCCQMRGWRRHMCFSTPFSSVHDFLRNQSIEITATGEQPASVDAMLGDMPIVEVSNSDDDPIEEVQDLGDIDDDDDDDLEDVDDDDDVTDDDDVVVRRPHHGKKGHQGRHQGRSKEKRRAQRMWRRCCKAGRDEGLGVETDQEASEACGNAATIYLQNIEPRNACKRAYEKCCIRAAMP